MSNTVKDKRTTFRMTENEYERLSSYAQSCGMDISTYVRSRALENITRLFYDPSMTAELRAYREELRRLAKDVTAIRQRIELENYVQTEEINQVRAILKSIFHKMEDIEKSINLYRKELEHGDYQIT